MLKANVGLSRKLTKDFNSSGFSLNLESEIAASVTDPEAVIEQVKELFDLAEEALRQQIERHRPYEDAPRHGQTPPAPDPPQAPTPPAAQADRSRPNETRQAGPEPASDKQKGFIQQLAKRQRLSSARLETVIAEALGRQVPLHRLTKREAGQVIDALNHADQPDNGR